MDEYEIFRKEMVIQQIKSRGVKNESVLNTMMKVPRHMFVPEYLQSLAYEDCALLLSHDQTISQPYIVALMTSAVVPDKTKSALVIGTGSGYQTAVLAELCHTVTSMEIIEELHMSAKERLKSMKYTNINCILGDGYEGYEPSSPYDIILVSACPPMIPKNLINQLAPGGKMAIPVGINDQRLLLVSKDEEGQLSIHEITRVRFVPMCHSIL